MSIKKFRWKHRESNSRLYGLWRSASTSWGTLCPLKNCTFVKLFTFLFLFLQMHIRGFNNRCSSMKWSAIRSDLMAGASEFSTWFRRSQKELTMVTDNVITFFNYTCLGFRISFFRWIIQQDVGWATGELQQQAIVTMHRCRGTKLISSLNVPFSGYLLLSCLSRNTGKIYENYKMQGSYRLQCSAVTSCRICSLSLMVGSYC